MKLKKMVILILLLFSILPLLLSMSVSIMQLKYNTKQIVENMPLDKTSQQCIQDLTAIQTHQILKINILFILLILLSIIPLCNFANKTIFYPLKELIDSIYAMKGGDYSNRFIYPRDNELGEISNAINSLIDKIIQESRKKKKEADVLKERAQKDTLTGLYNKGTTESLIEDFLAFENEDSIHALFIIDIDNFKSINDSLGHLYGDQVLSRISSSMLQIFRKSDILGRIGGDEFVIFVKNISSEEAIIEKANEIIAMFNHSYCDTLDRCLITGSIGIAVYPHDGKTFTELYKHADTALYKAKDDGKNCYHLLNKIICK